MIDLWRKYGLYCLIFLIALTLRVVAISQKQYMFFDSPFSVISSTPTNLSPKGRVFKIKWDQYSLETGHNYTIKQFKQSLFENKSSLKFMWQDLSAIRNHNIDAPSHTNLYYSILRIWNTGLDGINIKEMINRSCTLNLIFFSFSFFFLYKLLSLIKDDKKFISLGLFFGFLSTGSISNTLLIREYAMQETFLILFVYLSTILYKKIISPNNEKFFDIKFGLFYAISIALFLLSGYLSIICIAIILFSLFLIIIKKRKFQYLKKTFIICLLGLLITLLIYPSYFQNLCANSDSIANKNIIDTLFSFLNAKKNLTFLMIYLLEFLYYSAFVYLFLYFINNFFCTKKQMPKTQELISENIILYIIIFLLFLWAYTVLSVCVYGFHYPQGIRYILSIFPIISCLFMLLVYNFKKILILTFMLCYLITPIALISHKNQSIIAYSKIIFSNDYVFLDLKNVFNKDILQDSSEEILIYKASWAYVNYVMYLPDQYKIRFLDNFSNNEFKKGKYLLITEQNISTYNGKIISLGRLFADNIYLINVDKDNFFLKNNK